MIQQRELSKDAIEHRAYELYVERGGEPGNEVADWVKAEKELLREVAALPAKAKIPQQIRN
jgi:hypothetical protein